MVRPTGYERHEKERPVGLMHFTDVGEIGPTYPGGDDQACVPHQ